MAKGNTKKIEVEVPEVFSAHLVAFLRNNPHVKKVWINENGDYYLCAKPGYDEYPVNQETLPPLAAPAPDINLEPAPDAGAAAGENKPQE